MHDELDEHHAANLAGAAPRRLADQEEAHGEQRRGRRGRLHDLAKRAHRLGQPPAAGRPQEPEDGGHEQGIARQARGHAARRAPPAGTAPEVDFDEGGGHRHEDGGVDHRGDDGGQRAVVAESGDGQGNPHVAGVAEHSRHPEQADFGEPAAEEDPGGHHGEEQAEPDPGGKGGDERPVEDIGGLDARHRVEKQHRQRYVVDEAVQRLAAILAKEPEAAGQVSREKDGEDRKNDVGDGLHGIPAGRGGNGRGAIYPGGVAGGKRKRWALDGAVLGALKSGAIP